MVRHSFRVFSFNQKELSKAESEYLPFAKQGQEPESFLSRLDKETFPCLDENNQLLIVKMASQLQKPSLILLNNFYNNLNMAAVEEKKFATNIVFAELLKLAQGLKTLRKITENVEQNIIKKIDKCQHTLLAGQGQNECVSLLRDILEKLLPDLGVTVHNDEFRLLLNEMREPEQFVNSLARLIELTTEEGKRARIARTMADFYRGGSINDHLFSKENRTEEQLVDDFLNQLKSAGCHDDIAHFLLEYLNQGCLMLGANYHQTPLLEAGLGSSGAGKTLKLDIAPQPDGSVLVTHRVEINEFCERENPKASELPDEVQGSGLFQFKISMEATRSKKLSAPYEHLDIAVTKCHLDIFNPFIKEKMVDYLVDIAKKNIRQGIYLTSNRQFAVDMRLNKLKNQNGTINFEKIANLDADLFFLLLHNNLHDAETLCTTDNFNFPTAFFLRPNTVNNSLTEVELDLNLLKNKYHYSKPIIDRMESYLACVNLVKNQNLVDIKATLTNPRLQNTMLSCLYTITDVHFIKALLQQPNIRYRLNSSVLTHFALQDKTIAKDLLQPSFIERVRFKFRALFTKSAGECLPYTRFNSNQLGKIVQAHPSFWSNLFAPFKTRLFRNPFSFKQQYCYKLEREDLRKLIDTKKGKDHSFYRAANAINRDKVLAQKADLSLEERAEFLRDNPKITMKKLFSRKYENTWLELHGMLPDQVEYLTDSKLKLYYETKLSQEYDALDVTLLQAAEDLWATPPGPQRTKWSRLPAEKIALAREAVVKVIADKFFNCETSPFITPNHVPGKIALAEIFITNPIPGAYSENSFKGDALLSLQRALLDNFVTFKNLFTEPELKMEQINQFVNTCLTEPQKPQQRPNRSLSAKEERKYQVNLERLQVNKALISEGLMSLLTMPIFLQAVELSPGLNKAIRALLEHHDIKQLIRDNPAFFNLCFNDLEMTKSKLPPISQCPKANTHTKLQELYQNKLVLEQLGKIPVLKNYLEKLLITSRFKTALREQPDLTLFEHTWEKIKKLKEDTYLLEMLALLPEQKLYNWLDEREDVCRFILSKLLKNSVFHEKFMALGLNDVKDLLRVKAQADPQHLKELMIGSTSLGLNYLNYLDTIVKNDPKLAATKLTPFLDHLSDVDFALFIVKYPTFLPCIKHADLLKKYNDEISSAKQLNSHLSNEQDITNVTLKKAKPEELQSYVSMVLHEEKDQQQLSKKLACCYHPKVLLRMINQAPENLFTSISIALSDIALSLEYANVSGSLQETEVTKYCDFLLMNALINPKFMQVIEKNSNLKTVLNHYASPSLLANYLARKPVELNEWIEGLNRIKKEAPKAWIDYHPLFATYANYGYWLMMQENDDINSLLTETTAVTILQREKGEYSFVPLVNALLYQYDHHVPEEKSLQFILNHNAKARSNLLKKAFNHVEKLIELLLKELAFSAESMAQELSPLAIDILSTPILNYIVENANNESLIKLISKLNTKNTREVKNNIIAMLIGRIGKDERLDTELFNSPKLLEYCFNYAKRNQLLDQLLLKMLESSTLTKNAIHCIEAHEVDILEFFSNSADANRLASFWLLTEKHLETFAIIRLRIAKNKKTMKRMLSEQTHPLLIKKVICCLFDLIDKKLLSSAQMHELLKKALTKKLDSQDTVLLLDLISRISADDVIDLILLGGIEVDELNSIDYFAAFLTEKQVLNRLFLHASDEQLKKLFASKQKSILYFLAFAQKTSELGVALRQRLTNLSLHSSDLLLYIIQQTDEGIDNALLSLMQTFEPLFKAVLTTFINNPSLLLANGKEVYLLQIINKGTADDLHAIVTRSDENRGDNEFVQLIYQYFLDDQDEQLILRLLKLINDPVHLGLLKSLIHGLSGQQIVNLTQSHPTLNDEILTYFKNNPNDFVTIFQKDDHAFKSYLHLNLRQVYLLLINKIGDIKLTRVADEELVKTPSLARRLALHANPLELAQIYNHECTFKKHKPVSTILFKDADLLKSLLSCLYAFDDRFVWCDEIKDKLEQMTIESDPVDTRLIEAYYQNFDLNSKPVRLRADQDRKLNAKQLLGLYSVIFLRLLGKLRVAENSRARDSLYQLYFLDIEKITDINHEGVLVFKDDMNTPIPLDYAISYYQVLSRFFYYRKDIQKQIAKPKFKESLIKTINFDEYGNPNYSLNKIISHMPDYYVHTVLYAHSIELNKEDEEMSLPLALAFAHSVTLVEGKLLFKANNEAIPVPSQYVKAVRMALSFLAKSSKPIEESELTKKIFWLLQEGSKFSLEELSPQIIDSILDTLYVAADNNIYFEGAKEPLQETGLTLIGQMLVSRYASADKLNSTPLLRLVQALPMKAELYPDFDENYPTLLQKAKKPFVNQCINTLNELKENKLDYILHLVKRGLVKDLLESKKFIEAVAEVINNELNIQNPKTKFHILTVLGISSILESVFDRSKTVSTLFINLFVFNEQNQLTFNDQEVPIYFYPLMLKAKTHTIGECINFSTSCKQQIREGKIALEEIRNRHWLNELTNEEKLTEPSLSTYGFTSGPKSFQNYVFFKEAEKPSARQNPVLPQQQNEQKNKPIILLRGLERSDSLPISIAVL